MANINYLLYESAAGYAIFQVVNQADSVGLQLKEVQNSFQDLATFSKHIKLVSFAPYQYVLARRVAVKRTRWEDDLGAAH